MVGFITFHVCEQCARAPSHHAHVTELVVHRDFWGRGIGTALMKAAMALLTSMNVPVFIAERHEEHAASARTLEKNRFQIVDTYYDPERRASGTRNTTVSRYIVHERKNYTIADWSDLCLFPRAQGLHLIWQPGSNWTVILDPPEANPVSCPGPRAEHDAANAQVGWEPWPEEKQERLITEILAALETQKHTLEPLSQARTTHG